MWKPFHNICELFGKFALRNIKTSEYFGGMTGSVWKYCGNIWERFHIHGHYKVIYSDCQKIFQNYTVFSRAERRAKVASRKLSLSKPGAAFDRLMHHLTFNKLWQKKQY
jgi:hypothetical protein